VGNAAKETIYIGEADPVGERLKNHVSNKEGWVWGVYFFDRDDPPTPSGFFARMKSTAPPVRATTVHRRRGLDCSLRGQ